VIADTTPEGIRQDADVVATVLGRAPRAIAGDAPCARPTPA
jgi:hypothetical protein